MRNTGSSMGSSAMSHRGSWGAYSWHGHPGHLAYGWRSRASGRTGALKTNIIITFNGLMFFKHKY